MGESGAGLGIPQASKRNLGQVGGDVDQRVAGGAGRFLTLFGMHSNFEADLIITRLAAWLRPGDRMLISANLAPGPDLEAGVLHVLPQYDNPETKTWLRTVLEDHGVSADSGAVDFHVEHDTGWPGSARIAADWVVSREAHCVLDQETYPLGPGDRVRLFFSIRHTPSSLEWGLKPLGLRSVRSWIADSEEEGVFLVERTGGD